MGLANDYGKQWNQLLTKLEVLHSHQEVNS